MKYFLLLIPSILFGSVTYDIDNNFNVRVYEISNKVIYSSRVVIYQTGDYRGIVIYKQTYDFEIESQKEYEVLIKIIKYF